MSSLSNLGYCTVTANYYDSAVAKQAYILELPSIAECLTFDAFLSELLTIGRSISKNADLVTCFVSVLPKTLSKFTPRQQVRTIYLIGTKIYNETEPKPRRSFLDAAERLLQEINMIPFEFQVFLKPLKERRLLPQFALWRLARLTHLLKDFSPYEETLFLVFSQPETLVDAGQFLLYLSPNYSRQYLLKALMCSEDDVRINAIKVIEKLDIDTSDEAIQTILSNEKSPRVLNTLLHLPPKFHTREMLTKYLENPDISHLATYAVLHSPYLSELFPKVNPTNCELNDVDFGLLNMCHAPIYDTLASLLCCSQEILKDETLNAIAKLDPQNILSKLVFPRMGQISSWRVRFNSVQICKHFLNHKEYAADFAGFLVQMGLDPIYSVREAAFESFNLFPEDEMRNVIFQSFFSLASDNMTDFNKSIIRQMLRVTKPSIGKIYSRAEIEKVMSLVHYSDPHYFE